jgi:nucleotide-binding universal stress UspA family protein
VLLNTPREGAPVSTAVADEDTVRDLVGRAAAAGVDVEVRQDAHAGDLADEVVRVAGAVDASVIVIGMRRRSPVGKLLMGSTAQRILLDADRPVLAVKP